MSKAIPSDALYKFVDSKYTGVVLTARRAREILEQDTKGEITKPVIKALEEVMDGKITYSRASNEEQEGSNEEPEVTNEELEATE